MRGDARRSEPAREKPRERRVAIVAKWAARNEAFASVKPKRGGERFGASGFEAEPSVAARAGFRDDMVKQGSANAFAECIHGGPHRLYLAMIWRELFQRADPEQLAILAHRPEGNGWVSQADGGKHMTRLGRRRRPHLVEMHGQQFLNVGLVEIALVKRPFFV